MYTNNNNNSILQKQTEDPDKFPLLVSFTIRITNHAMSFHWDFFRLQAAAEMRFAAAVENTCLLPEWQNPLLMNYTRNCDYNTLEALYSGGLLLPLPYGFPLAPRIASARLLGRTIHDVPALEPPGIPEGCDESIVVHSGAEKPSESSFCRVSTPCTTTTATTTMEKTPLEEGTTQQEPLLPCDTRFASTVAPQRRQDVVIPNQPKTRAMQRVENLNMNRRFEISQQPQQHQQQQEILKRSDLQMIGKKSNKNVSRLADDSFLEPSFETGGIFDGPPALVIYVTNEPRDKRAKEEHKKVEDLHEVTGTTTIGTRGRSKPEKARKDSAKWHNHYRKIGKYKDRCGNTLAVEEC
jgi:hypothetical protein